MQSYKRSLPFSCFSSLFSSRMRPFCLLLATAFASPNALNTNSIFSYSTCSSPPSLPWPSLHAALLYWCPLYWHTYLGLRSRLNKNHLQPNQRTQTFFFSFFLFFNWYCITFTKTEYLKDFYSTIYNNYAYIIMYRRKKNREDKDKHRNIRKLSQ